MKQACLELNSNTYESRFLSTSSSAFTEQAMRTLENNFVPMGTSNLKKCRVGLLFFVVLFFAMTTSAQSFTIKKKVADRYNNRFEYYKAIPMYHELHDAQPYNMEIVYKLANAYYRINDSQHAEYWLKLITDSFPNDTISVLRLAQVLARNGKYNQSKEWYEKYAILKPADAQGEAFSSAYNNVSIFYKDSASYLLKNMPFNSSFSDFSPAYYKNGLVYASAREKKGIIRLWYSWTNSSYLDLYFALVDSSLSTEFMPGLNSLYHEGPVAFNKTFDTIIFTRSNFHNLLFGKSKEKINKLKLYQANWDSTKKKWVNVVPLEFNNNEYSCGHPALSADGNTLFFVSDMPGSIGGTDIYKTHRVKNENGYFHWSKPQNLGSVINTAENEMFPFIDNEGNLFFASNGHAGLGGLDIFMAKTINDGFENPVNLGFPINAQSDDFGFVISPSGNEGYFSTDRFNDVGNDDIYRWKKISRNLVILTYDKKNLQPLSSVNLIISNENSDPENKTTNILGLAPLVVKPSKDYQFTATRDKYIETKVNFTASELTNLDTIRIPLEKRIPKFVINGKVYAADDKQPFANIKAIVTNLADSSKTELVTDASGNFIADLQPEANYNIAVQISVKGKKCSANAVNISTKELEDDNVFTEMFPVLCVGDVIRVENIYYDLGKWDIRPDAAKELDKLLDMMNNYPKMRIELRSHTDSRGSDAANLALSDKRAKAAVAYLISKGIAPERIVGKGYGESIPLNKCKNGIKCSEEDYQVNRRTEFKILSIE
ncbi:MAG TPA: OmpA family protein [Bacteroidales bacterium]|nr:OmpA family protein [Bacteroidales bacterium]